jgi:transposase InsO family protein
MSERKEFVCLASNAGANLSELSRRFGLTRKTGRKWLTRFLREGEAGLCDRSRRPHGSPGQTSARIEDAVVTLRQKYPYWGPKKLYALLRSGQIEGFDGPHCPDRSTIARILKRRGLISEENSQKAKPLERFCYEKPNQLWQMDFKGDFLLGNQQRCHPFTMLDDHSRFNLALYACKNQKRYTVQDVLARTFSTYGLPERILCDNGSPWGVTGNESQYALRSYTQLEVWLMKLGIGLIHGRAAHPQTQGKEERFHRTLTAELLRYRLMRDMPHCQNQFDQWRHQYNCLRPHEAINMQPPISHYQVSSRPYPPIILPPHYDSTDITRRTGEGGKIHFKGNHYRIGKAFIGEWIAIRPTLLENIYEVYFYNQLLRNIILQ